mmetsp:Transcript_51033/g.111798  ORF Transcript_51033/g.111798 Transcript_51033/m.111798 type:complete len:206 (-) Transcript_51033:713-1330(-)
MALRSSWVPTASTTWRDSSMERSSSLRTDRNGRSGTRRAALLRPLPPHPPSLPPGTSSTGVGMASRATPPKSTNLSVPSAAPIPPAESTLCTLARATSRTAGSCASAAFASPGAATGGSVCASGRPRWWDAIAHPARVPARWRWSAHHSRLARLIRSFWKLPPPTAARRAARATGPGVLCPPAPPSPTTSATTCGASPPAGTTPT